jgi:regulator of protease activity HflC (stomatin/prohibitin superfamily)
MEITGVLIGVAVVLAFIFAGLRIVNEYERGVIFRLGKYAGNKEPGLKWIVPFIDRLVVVDLRVVARDVPPQDIITRDNVSVKVNAVIYFRVMDPSKAILQVENYLYATSQLAQTTLRSILGQFELDDLLAEREKINLKLQEQIDIKTEPWGIKISDVEVKHVDLPQEMQRAMAKQAEAERERRSKVIAALGEEQAAEKLSEAAKVLSEHPMSMQLRFLQTLVEVAAENNSTTIFPVPIDLLTPFMNAKQGSKAP